MPSGQNEATRLINVIGGIVDSRTKSGAGIEVTYGEIFQLSGYVASVYLAGSRELATNDGGIPEPSEGFRVPVWLKLSPGDHVRVSMDSRGHRWIDEFLPPSTIFIGEPSSAMLGSRAAILGRIVLGSGSTLTTIDSFPKVSFQPSTGQVWWSSGSSEPDVSLFRVGIGVIQTDGGFIASQGIVTKNKAGIPTDADLPSSMWVSGVSILDTTNSRIYYRVGSTWKYAALT